MDTDLCFLPATALSERIRRRDVSPVEIVTALLERIDRYNGVLFSYITVCADAALAAAREAEREITAGRRRGPLHGLPISHKDIVFTRGVRTTCHSRTMLDVVPDADATVVRRPAEAGMILLGKTNTTEFAIGTMDVFGTSRTPWNPAYYSGGSSGGAGSSLAAGLAVAATGSDTGGSIRIPGALCGIVGLKPTYGRVSRHGVFPLSYSMDHVGPMCRTVGDCALLLGALAGRDPLDPTSSSPPVPDYAAALAGDIRGLRLGVPRQHFYDHLDPGVDRAVRAALRHLESLGAVPEPLDLPRASEVGAVGWALLAAEAFAAHAALLRKRSADYGVRARQRIAGGAFLTAAEYQQAAQIRGLWMGEVGAALQRVDAIVTPTTPFAGISVEAQNSKPPDTTRNTIPFNLTGHPALTLPCGFTDDGLPVGLQLIGRAFDEAMLFRIGAAYEHSTEWHTRRPALEVRA